MKKYIYLFMILSIFILSGCSKKDKMASFIPTPVPEENTDIAAGDITPSDVPEQAEVTPTGKPVIIGTTTPMYVKLGEYGAFLNVRSTPSTEGEAVGFLVHAEKIDVIEIVDGWASFLYNNVICYVNADFLVNERPEYLNPPTPTPTPIVTPAQAQEASAPEI